VIGLCRHEPPVWCCRECKRAGLVPWESGDALPPGWAPPPGSPAERGEFPPAAVPAKPRLSIRELAARRRH
jgi:hypothetical protein